MATLINKNNIIITQNSGISVVYIDFIYASTSCQKKKKMQTVTESKWGSVKVKACTQTFIHIDLYLCLI